METISFLSTSKIVEALSAFHEALEAHKEPINRLNVYPVPDGDTGTNMYLTVGSVIEELEGVESEDRQAVCEAISHGSLMGARGNSGVILSQVLRGMSDCFSRSENIDSELLTEALTESSISADGAVMKPVEGTILTVVRESARSAMKAKQSGSITAVIEEALAGGEIALEKTPEQLEVLREAGVVDAGGAGFLLLLNAFLHVLDGRDLPSPQDVSQVANATDNSPGEAQIAELRYEVMYLLNAPDEAMDEFKRVWAGLGDSIVVVGGDGLWNCHIHTDDIGPTIEAAIEIGRPHRIRVTDLAEEVMEEKWVREATEGGKVDEAIAPTPVPCAVVAVSPAAGISRIFHSMGVQELVLGGQSMNPSTAELLAAVEHAPAEEVVILPNNSNIVAVARAVDSETHKSVAVVPTNSIPEGLACLFGYDPQADSATNAKAMAELSDGVTIGEVTQAIRDSASVAGAVSEGDWIGLDREGIRSIGSSLLEAATSLLAQIVAPGDELLSVIVGEEASEADTRGISEWVSENRPSVEIEIHSGGQSHYPFFFGVE